jgi:hypothetical protein
MARGKKTDYEDVFRIMISYFSTHNYAETSRQLNIPESTVKEIVKQYENADEFVELRRQKEDEFADKATEIINQGLILLKRRMNRAIKEEETLDELIEQIEEMPDDEMKYQQKVAIINKIKALQLQNMKDITTAVGTLYDKRALSKGEMTQNVGFATNISLDKLAEISGFAKKDADEE